MKIVSIAVLATTAIVATPAHAGTSWWNNFGGWWNHPSWDDDDHGWGGWDDWYDHDDDDEDEDELDEEYCDDDDHWGWGEDCDVTPPPPTGVPEIDANLLGTGLLLLVGGGLVLASRMR
jgi:hypothetical protein